MQFWILRAVYLVCFAIEVWALFNVLRYPNEAFLAADKRSKAFWGIITGVAVALGVLGVLTGGGSLILQLIAVTAAGVALADVVPSVRRVWDRRQGNYGRGRRG